MDRKRDGQETPVDTNALKARRRPRSESFFFSFFFLFCFVFLSSNSSHLIFSFKFFFFGLLMIIRLIILMMMIGPRWADIQSKKKKNRRRRRWSARPSTLDGLLTRHLLPLHHHRKHTGHIDGVFMYIYIYIVYTTLGLLPVEPPWGFSQSLHAPPMFNREEEEENPEMGGVISSLSLSLFFLYSLAYTSSVLAGVFFSSFWLCRSAVSQADIGASAACSFQFPSTRAY